MKKIGIIGLGNPLRQDDSIGIILLNKLKKDKSVFPKNIKFIDGGTGGMNLLHIFEKFDAVLLIDAVDFKGKPGELKLFKPDQVESQKVPIKNSTHDSDFLKVLEISKKLGELPEIFIFGIQPKSVSFGEEISPELDNSIKTLTKEIKKEILRITCKD